MAPIGAAVFATLLINDAYLPGAMVLGHSLKDRGAKAPLVAFVVADNLAPETLIELRTIYDDVVSVQQVTNRQPANLYVMGRPDLISTFTKIELWRQSQYKRIVYLDADTVVLRTPNELLTLDTNFAAVPDIGWPDCFNSGVMVLNPNMADYYSLLALAQRGVSFDGADQGLLNMHFREWHRLSFVFNCTPSGNYQYVPAYRHFSSSISVVHFIGKDKPWTLGRDNKYNTGVYGELLAHWWSVYDRHYRPKPVTYYDSRTYASTKKVQDYVRGEEPLYVVDQSGQTQHHEPSPSPNHQGQIPLPPQITITDTGSGQAPTHHIVELPFGDAPTPVAPHHFAPVPTVEQRRFSAPHVEWEPARAPPPVDSKPEAANFPTTIYSFTEDTKLFQAPTHYPEAPKDMWYQVPEKEPEPPKLKQIFPWESRAPKPTRVFAQPPPEPVPPPQVEPEPEKAVASDDATKAADTTKDNASASPVPSADPWAAFESRTNAWDEMPEIERYVRAFNQARKGKVQVLHHTPSQRSPRDSNTASSPAESDKRRTSLKLTDFPTEIERPSLPVTPAPIRRPSYWGDDRDDTGDLPTADGVPKQEDWVRGSSSHSRLEFPSFAPPLSLRVHHLRGTFFWRCQHCGKQNPVTRLEELQRRQSEVLLSPTEDDAAGEPIHTIHDIPQRQMPESASIEAVVEAAEKAMSPTKMTKKPKPILKEPKFELGQHSDSGSGPKSAEDEEGTSPTQLHPGFNPITAVGEAASESKASMSRPEVAALQS
ncbi:hypothetical protein B0A52_07263 [Exophiala mesophila]|uniref:glycogenin glucosyltransferase n=1 Tax=Exophiala mesophila TaxID=212818 RepID=A0A438MZ58_EXOME|nr:hypothetical protein B0A52_07263 [Exophiala mesophila]